MKQATYVKLIFYYIQLFAVKTIANSAVEMCTENTHSAVKQQQNQQEELWQLKYEHDTYDINS